VVPTGAFAGVAGLSGFPTPVLALLKLWNLLLSDRGEPFKQLAEASVVFPLTSPVCGRGVAGLLHCGRG